jgi:signal transduction histidine kinase
VLLDALLERVLLLHTPLAAARGITLTRLGDAALPPLIADADLLARAAGNLVSNAIKYSPAGTEVTVSARSENGAAAIAVTDQGYGIPEADRERIFDKFYRIPRVEDAGTPGTGLGLAFVREIAELHGGSITVSCAPGAGSTFTLRIPEAK